MPFLKCDVQSNDLAGRRVTGTINTKVYSYKGPSIFQHYGFFTSVSLFHSIKSAKQLWEIKIVIPILLRRKLRFSELLQPAHLLTAGRWRGWDLLLDLPGSLPSQASIHQLLRKYLLCVRLCAWSWK